MEGVPDTIIFTWIAFAVFLVWMYIISRDPSDLSTSGPGDNRRKPVVEYDNPSEVEAPNSAGTIPSTAPPTPDTGSTVPRTATSTAGQPEPAPSLEQQMRAAAAREEAETKRLLESSADWRKSGRRQDPSFMPDPRPHGESRSAVFTRDGNGAYINGPTRRKSVSFVDKPPTVAMFSGNDPNDVIKDTTDVLGRGIAQKSNEGLRKGLETHLLRVGGDVSPLARIRPLFAQNNVHVWNEMRDIELACLMNPRSSGYTAQIHDMIVTNTWSPLYGTIPKCIASFIKLALPCIDTAALFANVVIPKSGYWWIRSIAEMKAGPEPEENFIMLFFLLSFRVVSGNKAFWTKDSKLWEKGGPLGEAILEWLVWVGRAFFIARAFTPEGADLVGGGLRIRMGAMQTGGYSLHVTVFIPPDGVFDEKKPPCFVKHHEKILTALAWIAWALPARTGQEDMLLDIRQRRLWLRPSVDNDTITESGTANTESSRHMVVPTAEVQRPPNAVIIPLGAVEEVFERSKEDGIALGLSECLTATFGTERKAITILNRRQHQWFAPDRDAIFQSPAIVLILAAFGPVLAKKYWHSAYKKKHQVDLAASGTITHGTAEWTPRTEDGKLNSLDLGGILPYEQESFGGRLFDLKDYTQLQDMRIPFLGYESDTTFPCTYRLLTDGSWGLLSLLSRDIEHEYKETKTKIAIPFTLYIDVQDEGQVIKLEEEVNSALYNLSSGGSAPQTSLKGLLRTRVRLVGPNIQAHEVRRIQIR
jgi:hypothetical protein